MSPTIHTATTDAQILACWDVLHVLRPHLEPAHFLDLIKLQQSEGFHLIYIEQDGQALSAAGFRYQRKLYDGHVIYIDDLTTLPTARGHGYAGALLDFILEKARAEGLNSITLDSGHQRFDAHRLYLNKGFRITSHHFMRMF